MQRQKIRIKIKAFDHKIIDEVAKTIIQTAQDTGAIIAGPIPLPTRIEKFTVNKSTFVHKNAREQFEMRTHKRLIDIKETTTQTIDSLTNLTIPAGVDIEIKMLTGAEKPVKAEKPAKVKKEDILEERPIATRKPVAKKKPATKKKKA